MGNMYNPLNGWLYLSGRKNLPTALDRIGHDFHIENGANRSPEASLSLFLKDGGCCLDLEDLICHTVFDAYRENCTRFGVKNRTVLGCNS